jgi:hypothetical protein
MTLIRLVRDGAIALRSEDDLDAYESAVANFAHSGHRADLLRSMLSIGLGRDICTWHISNPGRRKVCFVTV